jgi:hypothetical protein
MGKKYDLVDNKYNEALKESGNEIWLYVRGKLIYL